MADEPKHQPDAFKPGTPRNPATSIKAEQIPLGPRTPSPARPAAATSAAKAEVKDNIREIVETVVFVVVLVLILKTFLAEAFVIPTGSMADTLLGYHKQVVCEKCGYPFLVNYSSQIDPPPNFRPQNVIGCYCPNCRAYNSLFEP